MTQVLPEIPARAPRTVHGKAKVVVRVAVDEFGKVTNATLEPGATSSAIWRRLGAHPLDLTNVDFHIGSTVEMTSH